MNQITLDAAEAAFQWTFIAKNTEKEKYIKNQCLKKKKSMSKFLLQEARKGRTNKKRN